MKQEVVVPNYKVMFESSVTILALVACFWLLIKLVNACFWFPQYMNKVELDSKKLHAEMERRLEESPIDEEQTEEEISENSSDEEENKKEK